MLSDKNIELLIEGAKEYGIALSGEQADKLQHARLLKEWNEKLI